MSSLPSCPADVADKRYSRVWGSATIGIDAVSVCIETHLANGLPKHTVVGLPRGAVRESLDRIWAALRATGYNVPRGILTVNLAPADVRKEGTAYDLPVAIGVIAADGQEELNRSLDRWLILGEVALDGDVRPVKGVLSSAVQARKDGLSRVIVPSDNVREAASVEDIDVYGVRSVGEAVEVLQGERAPYDRQRMETVDHQPVGPDFADVVGQSTAKDVLQIAAAGGHNVLMVGPPGCGKTMLAKRFPGLLPPLTQAESMETTAIHSLRGYAGHNGLIRRKPFRSPHHSITRAGMAGGGSPTLPGETSLAHNGVLFLDELSEFSRQVLESLREPMSEGEIVISRAAGPVKYPARFQLIAAMNPCPCGYRGTNAGTCTCSGGDKLRYRARISGPLLDRIDLGYMLSKISMEELIESQSSADTGSYRENVRRAIDRQRRRNTRSAGEGASGESASGTGYLNSHLPGSDIIERCRMTKDAVSTLNRESVTRNITMRSRDRVIRVSRTIADLEDAEEVFSSHVRQALEYRPEKALPVSER